VLLDAVAVPEPGWSGGRYEAACRLRAGGLAGTRVGVAGGYFHELLDAAVRDRFAEALDVLASLGAAPVPCDVGVPADAVDHVFAIVAAEAAPFHGPIVRDHAASVGPRLLARLSLPPPGPEAVAAHRAALAPALAELARVLDELDVLVLPTEPVMAPRIGAASGPLDVGGRRVDAEQVITRLTSFFDVAGVPAVSVPCGFGPGGLPVGLQVVARRGAEEAALAVAHAYEQATEWHLLRPPAAGGG
jgi:aspartyl-tRNA(Asn)/glutamyl-tRNA(Gln) amidotransferase subunit A